MDSEPPQSDEFLYGNRGPWPQPSPSDPDGMPAAVVHLPRKERLDFALHVLSRLRFTLLTYRPVARLYARLNPGLEAVNDTEFGRLLGETVLSKFLCPTLDAVDRSHFAPWLSAAGNDPLYKADFSAMANYETLPGLYAAATVTLFSRMAGFDRGLTPLAIRIAGQVLTPADGNAWELAKYFVLQGATCHLVTGFHARLHFPMDTINAISKTALPRKHLLLRLLLPHMRFSLSLNDRVLEHPRSLLKNSQVEIYTPFAGTLKSIHQLISEAYRGVPGNSAYPSYAFTLAPLRVHSSFGDFIDAYYETILVFTREVLGGISREDEHVRRWAHHISTVLPGFPDQNAIFEGDALARVAAHFIADVSVIHAADHHSFSQESLRKLPFRLRVPPPSTRSVPTLNRSTLVNFDDLFRYKMAHQLFFKPSNVTLLHKTRYSFQNGTLARANDRFLRSLQRVDETFRGSGFIPLREISRSIQY